MTDLRGIQRRELAALVDDLAALTPEQWRARTLCAEWDVEETVAHLGAAATTNMPRWVLSMVGARFDADLHNRRRLTDFRGADPAETLERFRAVGPIALPTHSSPAGLGELLVHAEDIRRPLGLRRSPDAEGLLAVATFFAAKDYAVKSKTLSRGLALRAVDADFHVGDGPEVRGPLLSLVMVMAGRLAHLADLAGDGVAELGGRLTPA
ncbi:maleylpyruvate isomerase family mycothiol-dependent enzyme [Actinosynnema pretiosum subsp. pretiosum]|uniref:Maleylpyruvate isomerase family mycothiol-dependent enzyme n=1 Tax=Actinosynnema pretiosum subsp. pretiosum TaxID=103721 RepID=A0AA45L8G7_9PSEU|nr:hypothetical protein APASM_3325 [Actinosynnema pretiosum subsp. pretiosum]QUF05187.1 maleylpyruvate isomerase family mycothiol-dependent enzyme [Actinosynnema pretiosum subsp. pretiosum]